MKNAKLLRILFFVFAICATINNSFSQTANEKGYGNLIQLFKEWRDFEKPPLLNGAPDYTIASFNRRQPDLLN